MSHTQRILLELMSGSGPGAPLPYTDSLFTGLVSVWELGEVSAGSAPVSRADSYGTNTLTDTGNVPSTQGAVNLAASFPGGTAKRLSCASNAGLAMGDNDFTLCAVVRQSGGGGIMGKWGSAGTREYVLQMATNTPTLTISANGTATVNCAWGSSVSTTASHLVIAWHDSVNDQLGIQVDNGTPVTVSHSAGIHTDTRPFCIGSIDTAATIAGEIELARVWRRILTSTERGWLWNSGAFLTYPFSEVMDWSAPDTPLLSPYNWKAT